MPRNTLQIKIVLGGKVKEEIIIDITLDRLGLWKEDVRKILTENKGRLKEFAMVHERFAKQADGSFLRCVQHEFIELDHL